MGFSCHNNLGPHHLCQCLLSRALRRTPERTLHAINYKYSRTAAWPFRSEWVSFGTSVHSCHNNLGPHYLCQRILLFSCALRLTPERTLRAMKYKYSHDCHLTSSFQVGLFGTMGYSLTFCIHLADTCNPQRQAVAHILFSLVHRQPDPLTEGSSACGLCVCSSDFRLPHTYQRVS